MHIVHLILIGFLNGNVRAAILSAEPDVLYNAIAMNAAETTPNVAAPSLRPSATVARMIDAVVYDYEYSRFVKFFIRVTTANKRALAKLRKMTVVFIGDDTGLMDNVVVVRVYSGCVIFAEITPYMICCADNGVSPTRPSRGAYFVYTKDRIMRMRYFYINAAMTTRFAAIPDSHFISV